MQDYLALYRGDRLSAAKIVAVSVDPNIVGDFAERMLSEPDKPEPDAVIRELDHGRRRALRLVTTDAATEEPDG